MIRISLCIFDKNSTKRHCALSGLSVRGHTVPLCLIADLTLVTPPRSATFLHCTVATFPVGTNEILRGDALQLQISSHHTFQLFYIPLVIITFNSYYLAFAKWWYILFLSFLLYLLIVILLKGRTISFSLIYSVIISMLESWIFILFHGL